MKFLKTFLSKASFVLLVTALSAVGVKAVGTLEPQGEAGDDTHKSLKDLLNKLTNFNNVPAATSSPFVTPGVVTATFPTLSEIYALLEDEDADLIPSNIAQGVTIFGVDGVLVPANSLRLQTLEWSADSANDDHTNAYNYCDALSEAGQTDWRLPTVKELHNGYFDASLPDYSSSPYWSNDFASGGFVIVVNPANGETVYSDEFSVEDFVCVRNQSQQDID